MRAFGFVLLLCSATMLFSSSSMAFSDSEGYDVAAIYEIQELERGTKVLDSWNNVKKAEALLIPSSLDKGRYEVELTRLDTNYYRICGTQFVIETRFCHEFATRDDAILVVKSDFGYSLGEVIFL